MNIKLLLNSESKYKNLGDVIYSENINVNKFVHFDYNEFTNKHIFHFEKGLTIYGSLICDLINSFNEVFRKKYEFKEFIEMAFPRLLTNKIANCFDLDTLWPYYLLSANAKNPSKYDPIIAKDQELILDPVQCPWFYRLIAENIDNIKFPFKVRESIGGWSYRNESIQSIEPLLKDITFLRTEFVFAGDKIDVKNIRIDLLNDMCIFLYALNIPYRLVIGNGCYDSIPSIFTERLASSLYYSDIPVIDIEVFLPFKDEWIEVSGASYFGPDKISHFVNNKSSIESGCFGIGTSRLALAFLANNGLNKENWINLFQYE
ncbi:MAG: hypothetical protein JW973_15375 [Bacteroidales bacterium]|nr:hypothetical protein [Bacteroidales bacterium]